MNKFSKLVVMLLSVFSMGTVFAQQATESGGGSGAAAGGIIALLLFTLIPIVVGLVFLVGLAKTFSKAGQPGWAVIIPIFNLITLLNVAKKPVWWFLLFLIPGVNAIIGILVSIAVAKAFGKGAGFGLGLVLFPYICYPMLGFGSAEYIEE